MIVNDKKNFVPIMVKMLEGLNYSNVKSNSEGSPVDITAEKDGQKYSFKCRFDIDAVGAKYIEDFAGAASGSDKKIFITNSSFISSAKKLAQEKNVELWDRNTIDRMSIGISEKLVDEIVPVKKNNASIIAIVIIVLLLLAGAAYWYFFMR